MTAARQKESEGVRSRIIHSLKRSSCVVGWHENEFPQDKRHRAGSIAPETESAFLRRSGQSCMTNLWWRPLVMRSKSSSRSSQRVETTCRIPLRLNPLTWSNSKQLRTLKGMIGSIRLDSRGTQFPHNVFQTVWGGDEWLDRAEELILYLLFEALMEFMCLVLQNMGTQGNSLHISQAWTISYRSYYAVSRPWNTYRFSLVM